MSFTHYLLQVHVYLIVFYCFYRLLLDNETYFTLNRIFLISSGVLSLCIPFLRIEWLTSQPVYTTANWNAVLTQATLISDTDAGFNWSNVIAYLYCAGMLFFLGRLLFNILMIKKLLLVTRAGVAFAFFGKKRIDPELPQLEVIDIHEETHVKQWHTLDVLFFEIIGILTWLNPVIYLYKKTIKNIHEFLADEQAAIFQGDKADYAMLLLSRSFGISPSSLTNGFFEKSQIKKRIFMLSKERSKKIVIVKYGIFIPLTALLLVLSSATVRKNEKLISISNQIKIDKPLEMVQTIFKEEPDKKISTKKVEADNKPEKNNQKPLSLPSNEIKSTNEEEQNTAIEDKRIYDFVSIDKQPEYKGGMKNFYQYISSELKYPEESKKNKTQGKVFLSFVVEKDGSLSDISITRGLTQEMNEEAIRVLQKSPKWEPAVNNGQPVRVKYNININFQLKNDTEQID
ncbi:TonB family protein [Pedobacter sp. MW01-1-1]|uniref:TonB family protein n=1 Tax=Pedobacter sp. MW01-1-1 TaxID=3383027 RepID=UPI003FEE18AA